MIRSSIAILSTILSISLSAQTNYKGNIGKYPIELVTRIYSDGDARAIYTYQKYNDPIVINGRKKSDTLILFEKDKKGKVTATLTFLNFNGNKQTITGIWENLQTKQALPINLHKDFEITDGPNIEWPNREIIQDVSLNDYYFKLVISKTKQSYYPTVSGVKILQKKTDSLIQFIETDCELMGLGDTEIDDYNFDGFADFSIFESHYAGPNTARIYFLFNPQTKTFFDAGFKGVSLHFDQKEKKVFEHNQCCGGRMHTIAKYKIVDNKMILVEQHCYTWSEEKQDLVEREMKDCQ